jgi:hypothetical protein
MVGNTEACSCKIEFLQITLSLPNNGWYSVSVKTIICCSGLLCFAYTCCMLAMPLVALFSALCCSLVVHISISCVERRNMMALHLPLFAEEENCMRSSLQSIGSGWCILFSIKHIIICCSCLNLWVVCSENYCHVHTVVQMLASFVQKKCRMKIDIKSSILLCELL